MRESLEPYLEENAYRRILSLYHFEKTDAARIRSLADCLLETAAPVLYHAPYGSSWNSRLGVLVTLGAGVDDLQESYMAKECLTESYMIECIAMELLQNAYEQAAERIYGHYGRWADGFDFLGETVPIERMEELFELLQPKDISYNRAYMLTPKKTAAFCTTLTDQRRSAYCNLCDTCGNTRCVHRKGNLTYGYQRIFGERGVERRKKDGMSETF